MVDRRDFLKGVATGVGAIGLGGCRLPFIGPRSSVPTPEQLAWQEDCRTGHRVRAYRVDAELAAGGWRELCRGTCVGHKRIEVFAPVAAKALRVTATEAVDVPLWRSVAAFHV